MWEEIKNNPLAKTFAVLILGVLGFGFAFNVMFGRNETMEHGMSGGYSLDSTLAYILNISIKLLLISLVVIGILYAVRAARKHFGEGSDKGMFDMVKNDPILKVVSIILVVILAFGLIYMLFGGIFGMNVGMGYRGYNMNVGYGLSLTGVLVFLIKLLLVVSVVGLVIGIAVYLLQGYKKTDISNIFRAKANEADSVKCNKCGKETIKDSAYCPYCGESLKKTCKGCGIEIKNDWNCCPNCGKETASEQSEKPIKVSEEVRAEESTDQESVIKEADTVETKPEKKNNKSRH